MDQIMIGRFIAECRKENKLTQAQLAEKLGITDRAVSKWLCELLGISINDLFNGRRVTMENYKEAAETAMLHLKENEEKKNRMLLNMEIGMLIPSVITLLELIVVVAYVSDASSFLKANVIVVGVVQFCIYCFYALMIETDAGYYKCKKCGHAYVPGYKAVLMAPNIGRNRKMTCPCCNKKTWHKKILTKD